MRPQQDALVRWAAQAVPERGRRLDTPDACVVVATGLNRRDRIVVTGAARAAQPLVESALSTHPDHVVLGEADLVRALHGLREVAEFGWMELHPGDDAPTVDTRAVAWDPTDDEVSAVLAVGNPTAWVQARDPAVRRWAGLHGPGDELVSVGALAHCADDVAFLAGVATRPEDRGRGASTLVCAALRDEGRSQHGTVALMVDGRNAAAQAVYHRLGFRYRAVVAAVAA